MFYVGQKVVCVDAGNNPGCSWLPGEAPVGGQVYTVRKIRPVVGPKSGFVLTLVEIQRSPIAQRLSKADKLGWWVGYAAERFRPVVERKTDISIFKAMLNPSDERVTA